MGEATLEVNEVIVGATRSSVSVVDASAAAAGPVFPARSAIPFAATLNPAKVGALTTRTDNTTGTLTMSAGHGLLTGNRLDLYWTNADGSLGARRGILGEQGEDQIRMAGLLLFWARGRIPFALGVLGIDYGDRKSVV